MSIFRFVSECDGLILSYVGTIDGRHEFFIRNRKLERIVNLGSISLAEAQSNFNDCVKVAETAEIAQLCERAK